MTVVAPLSTFPVSGFSCSVKIFRKVVFPAPFGPTMPTFSPFLKMYENGTSTLACPKDLLMFSNSRILPPCRRCTTSTSTFFSVRSLVAFVLISSKASIRALDLVVRAFGCLLIHSSSFRIRFLDFSTSVSSLLRLSSFFSR